MIRPEDTRNQAPPTGEAPTQQPGSPRPRRVTTWQKALAALILLICLIGGGFLIAQNGRSTPTPAGNSTGNSASTPVLPKPWCAASDALANNFYGTSISSLAANDVWSAGTQIRHWNGSAWSVSYTPASQQSVLRSILEIAPDNVWVVGEQQGNGMPSHPLTLHWDGSKWQSVSSPDVAAGGKNALAAVSGTSANDVWAVGFAVPLQGPIVPLIEHWNGSAWSIQQLNTSSSLQFTSVKALTSSNVWAVGYEYSTHAGKNVVQPVTEHWNGSKWSAIANPDLQASGGGNLYNINGDSASDLWAVGSQNSGSQLLTEHWNGTKWSVVANPNVPPGNSNWLASVAVSGPNNVWAVGRIAGQGGFQPFIEHWDGKAWEILQDPSGSAGELDIIANVGQQVWVIGLPRASGGHAFIETLCP